MTTFESLEEVARAAVRLLERRKARYMVTGMFAGNYWLGNRAERFTYDVDVVIWVPPESLDAIARELGWDATRRTAGLLTLRVPDTPYRLDFLPAASAGESDPEEERLIAEFREDSYRRSRSVTVGRSTLRLCRPEDVIITKVFLNRPKDGPDICLLLRIRDLDRPYLAGWLERLEMRDRFADIVQRVCPGETMGTQTPRQARKERRGS